MPEDGLKILVCGAGIAGPVLVYWLRKNFPNAVIIVVDRARSLRTAGQNVDVRKVGVDIMDKMGLMPKIRDKTTTEVGVKFVDERGRRLGTFPSQDHEILRGDLARILYEATKDDARYIFGEYVQSIVEQDKSVRVEFKNNQLQNDSFDLVVAADGQDSKTRSLAFGSKISAESIRSLHAYFAYFSIPRTQQDDKYATWCNAPGGRVMLLRPDQYSKTRVTLDVTDDYGEELDGLQAKDVHSQKMQFARIFEGAGWESQRIVEALPNVDDFHCHLVAQVKMPCLHTDRVVLVGDAGYSPSPITGMGTTLAIQGAYLLADKIAKFPADIPRAFAAYETEMRPIIKKGQKVVPGAPGLAHPKSRIGIFIFQTIVRIVSLLYQLYKAFT